MNALSAVLVDLWWFALGRDADSVYVPTRGPNRSLGEQHSPEPMVKDAETLLTEADQLAYEVSTVLANTFHSGIDTHTVAPDEQTLLEDPLFTTLAETLLYPTPQIQFDGQTRSLEYGTQVRCDSVREKMIHITTGEHVGWIARSAVTNDTAAIVPQFQSAQAYTATTPDTIKLRQLIHDAFKGSVAQLPLQDAEFVTYRLQQNGHVLPWPEHSAPRTAGRWRGVLADQVGIRVTAHPTYGSVMEWYDPSSGDQLGLVEAVLPDESLRVTTVLDSYYTELHLEKERWEALAPTFIVCI